MKKDIELFIFDLDGTLCESSVTIYKAMVDALALFKVYKQIDLEDFKSHIGKHFKDIFEHYEIKIENLEDYIVEYKKNYYNYLPYTRLYPNVRLVLDNLKSKNKKIALLSTKAQDQCEKILRYFQIDIYFDIIKGRTPGKEVKPSPQSLFEIASNLNVSVSQTLIIGDTELDILCGKNAGSLTCAATYGYRSKAFLKAYNPDFTIDSIEEIIKIFLINYGISI